MVWGSVIQSFGLIFIILTPHLSGLASDLPPLINLCQSSPHTPWCSTSHQPGCRLSFCWHPDSSGLANKCLTFFHQCRYSKIWKERLARTYCIKLGTQTNAYRGYEVGQGKSNTQGVSELWQTVAMVQPKIFKFNLKMQNTIPAKLHVSASLGAQSATVR